MLKILQASLQQYVNQELPDVSAGFRRGRGTRDLIVNIHWILEKAKEFQKNIYVCFTDYTKAFDYVDHKKICGKFLKRWEYQTTLAASWETCMQVKKQPSDGTWNDWFKIGKGVWQGYILSPNLFNLYAEYIMWNDRLDGSQFGIKIVGRNGNNLRYADDTTLMTEKNEEVLKTLMRVKEKSEEAGLKLNTTKLRTWHLVPSLHDKQKGKRLKQWQILFSWAPKSIGMVTATMKLKDTCSLEKKLLGRT